jgi:hypothetical protein
MKKIRRWAYLGLGMLAWKVGRPYLKRRWSRRDASGGQASPPPA